VTRVPAKLAAEWRRKLRASGFVDSEDDRERLIRHGSADRRSLLTSEQGGGAEYYRYAGHWLYFRVWRSRLARRAWELHSEGLTRDQVVLGLGTWRGASEHPVSDLLQEEREAMGAALRNGQLAEDDPDERPEFASAFDEELASFDWVRRRGEGGGDGND
jgi:hypothetical protein